LAPAVVEVTLQEPLPLVSAAVQVALPSLTVTLPVGVPLEPLTVYATA
jgi:hypothetical protein